MVPLSQDLIFCLILYELHLRALPGPQGHLEVFRQSVEHQAPILLAPQLGRVGLA